MNLGELNQNTCTDCGTSLQPMKQQQRAGGEFWQCPQCKRVWRVKNDPRRTHTTDNREGKPL
jgi:Zn-finger nucleic acid-binding protein